MATLTQGEIYAVAVIAGLPEPTLMSAIAMAESSGRTGVVNSIGCVGLWQINQPVHVKAHPKWTKEWLANPFNNAQAAKVIYKSQGLKAWEVYTNGAYKKYASKPGDTSLNAKDLGMSDAEFDKAIKGQPGVIDRDSDSLAEETVDAATGAANKVVHATGLDVLADVWEALTTPSFWMRVAYGVTGVALVAGGLFLIVKNTAVSQAVGQAGKALGGSGSGKVAGAQGSGKGVITKNEMAAQLRTGGAK